MGKSGKYLTNTESPSWMLDLSPKHQAPRDGSEGYEMGY